MPALGQIVLYTLSVTDVREITMHRAQVEAAAAAGPVPYTPDGGSDVRPGDVFPAVVVRVGVRGLDPEPGVSLRVLLDGTDVLWAVGRAEGTHPGTWAWPGV